jgi:hypothetical protein
MSRQHVGLLGQFVAALGFPAAAQVAPTPQTQCDPANLGRELRGEAVSGVPLIAGLQTGMTRQEVKRIAPLVSTSRLKLELFPGMAFPAVVNFKRYYTGPLETVSLSGRAANAPVKALTEHFGLPVRIDGGMTTMPNLGETMPAYQSRSYSSDRFSLKKWCDGPRVFILYTNEDQFGLTVAGPRTRR